MKPYLLCGSYAYDTILLHAGQFHTKILPESLARLNVSFGIDNVDEQFGGTAGNIAYNATLLEQYPLIAGCLGGDGKTYIDRMESLGLDTSTLSVHSLEKCAHAWLMTDTTNNQIIGFNGGAMKYRPAIPAETPDLWHLSADNPSTTAWLAKKAIELGKSYFFDPGQALPYFSDNSTDDTFSLKEIIENATGIFVNDYEGELLENKLGISLSVIVEDNNKFVIKTLGSKGVEIYGNNSVELVGVAKPQQIVDPTGCGDAFRAGFLYGYTQGYSLDICAKLGSTMGSFAIENSGGQNHQPNIQAIIDRTENCFNVKLNKGEKKLFNH